MAIPRNHDALAGAHCTPMEGKTALTPEEIAAQLTALPEWRLEDGAIVRSFGFSDYHETMAFVNALAYMVHREDHHPDLLVCYGRVRVAFNTHSVGGVSLNDFICAAKVDLLYEQRPGPNR